MSVQALSRGGGVKDCPDGLGHFFPCPNGQFFVSGGQNTVNSALFNSFRQCQRPFEKIGSKKVLTVPVGGGQV